MNRLKEHTLVYVGTPYSKYPYGIEQAFLDACVVTAKLVEEGIVAFSPVVACHPITRNFIKGSTLDPFDHGIWLPLMRPILNAASCFLVVEMAGWSESVGIKAEIVEFNRRVVPIYYLNPTTMKVQNVPHYVQSTPLNPATRAAEEGFEGDRHPGNGPPA